jgi:hypothetical protein
MSHLGIHLLIAITIGFALGCYWKDTQMFGDGISLIDLTVLLKNIREKQLTLQVKITDGPWEDLSSSVISNMIQTVKKGIINDTNDIRLRLFNKNKG